MKAKRDESKLPKWAQRELEKLRYELGRVNGLRSAHALLCESEREWFTIPNKRKEKIKLWLLYPDNPFPVCSLGPGDTLLVGRAKITAGEMKGDRG